MRTAAAPLEHRLGRIEQFCDETGQQLYYVIHLQPSGFIVLSADDQLEPVIAFSNIGRYTRSNPANPLTVLVDRDVQGRLRAVGRRKGSAGGADQRISDLAAKWQLLASVGEASDTVGLMGYVVLSDTRVEPLLRSHWAQYDVCGSPCYNYYTPNNYHTGCVATAMAQLMRYYEYPTSGIGLQAFWIREEGGQWYGTYTRGGDGRGGPYDWNSMILTPNCTITETQRQAIGALCFDAAASINTIFGPGASQADTLKAKDALVGTFGLGHAVKGYNGGKNIGQGLIEMINPNLDAGHPVILGINGTEGHAAVCDGYGYHGNTLYHHLNMGWGGLYDAWYNLPNIDAAAGYTLVHKCIYNIRILKVADGEVLSGRVLDVEGNPIDRAAVYIAPTETGIWSGTFTNSKGIYAFDGLTSNTSYTLRVFATGYKFEDQQVTTGRSVDNTPISGNLWGVDFYGLKVEVSSIEPDAGPPASYVVISGENFGSALGTVVFPKGRKAEILQWSPTLILCRVPDQAESGEVYVLTNDGTRSLGKIFEVTDPQSLVVDQAGADSNAQNGTEQYPFSNIDRAITAATQGDHIIVKPGTYQGCLSLNGKNVLITSIDPNDPAVVAATVIDAAKQGSVLTFTSGENRSCRLEGLTITGGMAKYGGAIFCNGASPSFVNCRIVNNSATNRGGAVYCTEGDCLFYNCSFENNIAATNGGATANQNGFCELINCRFLKNVAGNKGGALYNLSSNPTILNCTFSGNRAVSDGGAITNYASSPLLVNCVLVGNRSDDDGGAIYNRDDCHPVLINCTICANYATDTGGGVYNSNNSFAVEITNCILWGNTDKTGPSFSAQLWSGTPTVNNCCIQGWNGQLGGSDNFGEDPRFVRAPNDGGDGWGLGENDDFGDLRLTQGSPCIDAGDNSALVSTNTGTTLEGNVENHIQTDAGGIPRYLDEPVVADRGKGPWPVVDIGAYEFAGLIAYWKLDEISGSTTPDELGVSNGTVIGDPEVYPVEDGAGSALFFDGQDDYIRLANERNFDLTAGITVAAWIKISSVEKNWQTIIAKGDSAWRLSTKRAEPRIHFAVTGGPSYHHIDSQTVLQIEQWHHVCGTYDGRYIRLFIDGVEDPASPVEYRGGITTNDFELCIGENLERRNRYWHGAIDEVRIYNYALSAEQISRLLCPNSRNGDLNNDRKVDMADLALLLSAWQSYPGHDRWNSRYDISTPADQIIDTRDLNVLLEHWLSGAR